MHFGGIHAGHIKAASIATKAALAAQVAALFLGVLKIAVALSLDGQHFIVQIQGDIFFAETGQVALHHIGIADVTNVRLELCKAVIAKERTINILKIAERIVAAVYQHSHKSYLLKHIHKVFYQYWLSSSDTLGNGVVFC